MSDLELLDGLIEHLKLGQDIPADVTGAVANYNGGSQLQLAVNPGGAADAWAGAILEFTSGDAQGKKAVIAGSNGAVLTLMSPLNKMRTPDPGDTVRLYGGPLKLARIYKFEPSSIKKDMDAGKKYFIMVMSLSGDSEAMALRGGRNEKKLPTRDLIGFEIIACVPDITGTATSASALQAIEDLPLFKEQLIFMINWFWAQEENRVTAAGPISWGYLSVDIVGADRVMLKACTINFDLEAT